MILEKVRGHCSSSLKTLFPEGQRVFVLSTKLPSNWDGSPFFGQILQNIEEKTRESLALTFHPRVVSIFNLGFRVIEI